MDVWKKLREDGPLGLYAVLGGVRAVVRRGGSLPAGLRLRWRLREIDAELDAAYEALGRHIAAQLTAGGTVEPSDAEARRSCQRIDALRAEAKRLRDELAAQAWESS
jgi:hypothetical protein